MTDYPYNPTLVTQILLYIAFTMSLCKKLMITGYNVE